MGVERVDFLGSFEDLYDGFFTVDFEDLTFSDFSRFESDIDDFSEFGEFDVVENDQGTIDFDDGSVVDTWGNVVISHCRGCINFGEFWILRHFKIYIFILIKIGRAHV